MGRRWASGASAALRALSVTIDDFKPGQRIRILQEIERREGNWRTEVVGVIEQVVLEKTGSWFAHAKDDKYWLLRVRLRKDDGELTTVVVDPLTRIEPVGNAAPGA